MSSRAFILLGLLAAFVLLFASEVAAQDMAETASSTDKKDFNGGHGGVGDAGQGFVWGSIPGGYRGGSIPGGRGCYYGCCGGYYYGSCRCCVSAAEAAQKAVEVKPHN